MVLLFFAVISLGSGQLPTLSASPSAVNPADKITVVYSGAPGFDTDWIAIYRIDAANERYGEWSYLRGEKSGTLTFAAPQELGEYEFRMFKNWAG
ncbi:MAG TPA: LamG domain-containing protein, partial [Methanothrix sp.]|nr:LamG domain-containing protein [Methanothrix sp.]